MPPAKQTFYKMRCGWATDPKVAALARFGAVDACLARDLFGQLIDYARRELTDGLVPADEIGRLAYPLPAPDAMRVAEQLADPGPWGPLCSWDTPGNGESNTPGNALRILAYAKWNDTRADVDARAAWGEEGARKRWGRDQGRDSPGNAKGNAPPMHRGRGHVDADIEKEKDTPLPPAAGQWSPHDSLDPPPAPKRGGGSRSRPADRRVEEIRAAARRPGGPATDEQRAAHAAEARRMLGIPVALAEPEIPGQLPLIPAAAPAEADDEYPF
jgi:hypothetical protein